MYIQDLENLTTKQEASVKEIQTAYNKDINMRDEANLVI